ncbi:hypothetical protein ACTXT7_010363 [Hymenolepis weldensis]
MSRLDLHGMKRGELYSSEHLAIMFHKSSFQNPVNTIPLILSLAISNVWSEQEQNVSNFASNMVALNGRSLLSWPALIPESTITIDVGVSRIYVFTITFVSGIAITLEVIRLASNATPASVESEAVVPPKIRFTRLVVCTKWATRFWVDKKGKKRERNTCGHIVTSTILPLSPFGQSLSSPSPPPQLSRYWSVSFTQHRTRAI